MNKSLLSRKISWKRYSVKENGASITMHENFCQKMKSVSPNVWTYLYKKRFLNKLVFLNLVSPTRRNALSNNLSENFLLKSWEFLPNVRKDFWVNKNFETDHFPQSFLLNAQNSVLNIWPKIVPQSPKPLSKKVQNWKKSIFFPKKSNFAQKFYFWRRRIQLWYTCW